jgi:hypothetical protein
MYRIDSSRVMVAKEEDNELTASKNQWPSRNEEMKELLGNKGTKEMERLRIELAEDKRRIAQLEEQNDDLLLELASLKMEMSASSVKSGFDGGGSDSSLCVVAANDSFSNNINSNNDDRRRGEQKMEVISDGSGSNNSNATIPRRNSVAITFPRCSPHGRKRATIGRTTPNAANSCLSSSSAHSTLRHCSDSATHITSRRCSRRVTIGVASPYSANDLSSSSSSSSSSAHSIPRRRISSSSKDLLRIYNGFVSLDDNDEAQSSGGVRNSRR